MRFISTWCCLSLVHAEEDATYLLQSQVMRASSGAASILDLLPKELCMPEEVSAAHAQLGKGINGGKNCGHESMAADDWKFGPKTDTCTRFILCESEGQCQASGITSANECAAKAGASAECAQDYIEWRGGSHCFCNPAGRTWSPDTSYGGSTVYSMLFCPITGTDGLQCLDDNLDVSDALATAFECADFCARTDGCNAWTWNGGGNQKCNAKNSCYKLIMMKGTTSGRLGMPEEVYADHAQPGKGINGGKNCGHESMAADDWKFGPKTDTCTRFILCESEGQCQASGITSANDCATKAGASAECAQDYIEWRGGTHCFCNPAGRTWLPDTSYGGSTVYSMSGQLAPPPSGFTYDEVWKLPKVEYIATSEYKTEAAVRAACDDSANCPGYWVAGTGTDGTIVKYVTFVHGSRTFGIGSPNPSVLHVFAKDAPSDLVKLGVSDAKYDYAEGKSTACTYFGIKYPSEADAQAACNFVGTPCIGYWKGGPTFILLTSGTRTFAKGSPNAGVESVMLKGKEQANKPTKAEAVAAKRARKKAEQAARKAARLEKKVARLAAQAVKKAARAAKKAARAAKKAARSLLSQTEGEPWFPNVAKAEKKVKRKVAQAAKKTARKGKKAVKTVAQVAKNVLS